MRKKSLLYMAAALAIGGGIGLSSCSSDELPVGSEVQVAAEAAETYSFSATAIMDDEADTRVFDIGESTINSRFSTDESVYVFIKKGNYVAYASSPLKPANVSADGKTCTLAVDGLSFILNTEMTSPRPYTPQAGDEVYLYYGMYLSDPGAEPYYDFRTDGSKLIEELKDYSLAEMVVKEVDVDNGKLVFGQKGDETKEYFTFKNINSIFRQKLIFTDKHGNDLTPNINISEIKLSSKGQLFVEYYYPFSSEPYRYNPIVITNPDLKDGNIFFPIIFNDKNKEYEMMFEVKDTDYNTYVAYKPAPSGGFENNKYYYGNVNLYPNREIPTITNALDKVRWRHLPGLSEGLLFDKDSNYTISGISEGCFFNVVYNGISFTSSTITLDNLTAEVYDSGGKYFIGHPGQGEKLTINLKGDNFIKMNTDTNSDGAVFFNGATTGGGTNTIKFKCEGDSATLKIWVKGRGHTIRGFYWGKDGTPNFDDSTGQISYSSASPLSIITESGFMMERSASIPDGDGYYWIFTVKKKG